jgi:hypothetical protein
VNNLAKELAKDVKILKATRANMLLLLSKFSLEEVNRIPEGFNNNLAWNAGHCLVTHKRLVYDFCGHDTGLSPEMIAAFRKGSKPEGDVSQELWSEILEGLNSSVGQLKSDLEVGGWQAHSPYTTSYGVTIIDVRSGVRFNNAHEAMHLGIMMAMGRLL